MLTASQVQVFLSNNGAVVDEEGNAIGAIRQVFLDAQTGQPVWATVTLGVRGGAASVVPLAPARLSEDTLRLPFCRDEVNCAPRVGAAQCCLGQDDEAGLVHHYGMHPAAWSTVQDGPLATQPVG